MMEMIVLIPGLICLLAIIRNGTPHAFRFVYLPTLLLMPMYFYWTVRPIPPLNFATTTLLVLGVGMFLTNMNRWRLTRTDLWVLIFIVSSGYTDFKIGHTSVSLLEMFNTIVNGMVPYMAGKLLIEQPGNRVQVAKTYVWLITVSSFVSAWEYVGRMNPYTWFWSHFFRGQWAGWKTQFRWGFGRVAGPFSQSELAGMMVLTAWLLALWVGRRNYDEVDQQNFRAPLIRNGRWHIWIVFVALFTTQARGPWIGALVGLAVAGIGRAKKPLRRGIIVFVGFVVIGLPVYTYGKSYLAGPRKDFGSERETAQYRQELIQNYIPVAEKGGAWGWGQDFPRINGQQSIDNEYLWAWLQQGYIGLSMLVLLLLESSGALLLRAVRSRTVRERHFVFTMLGIMVGITFTISTVFLGDQPYQLLFLLFGWSQAITEPRIKTLQISNEEVYRPAQEPEYIGA